MNNDFVRRVARLEKTVKRNLSSPSLARSAIEDGAIEEYDSDGNLVQVVGAQPDGTHTVVSVNGPLPPAPIAPYARSVEGGLVVYWDGEFVGGAVAPLDFTRVEVHVGPDTDGFDPVTAENLRSTFETPRGGEQFIALDPGTYFVALVTRTQSGRASDSSEQITAEAWPIAGAGPVTDGNPPASSPVLRVNAGLESAFLAWDSVPNADPVSYSVYGSTATPVAIDKTNLIDTTSSLRTLASDLVGGTTYYFVVQAFDADGAAPPSPEVSVAPKAGVDPSVYEDLADTSAAAQAAAQQAAADAVAAQAAAVQARADATAAQAAAATSASQATDAAADASGAADAVSGSASTATAAQQAAAAAQAAAEAAEARAATAEQAAVDAAEAAGNAGDSANGVNRVWYGTAEPPTTERTNVDGDTWFVTSDDTPTANIVGVNRWSAGAWVPAEFSHETIASIDLGKATVGELDAIYLKAGTVGALQVNAEILKTNEIYAQDGYLGSLSANQITAGNLDAQIGVLGSLSVGDNITIDPENGIKITLADGQISFPSDGSAASITADINALSLTTNDRLSILGKSNEIGTGAQVLLSNGVSNPTQAPSTAIGARATPIPGPPATRPPSVLAASIWRDADANAPFEAIIENPPGATQPYVYRLTDDGSVYTSSPVAKLDNTKIHSHVGIGAERYVLVNDHARDDDVYLYHFTNPYGTQWNFVSEHRLATRFGFNSDATKVILGVDFDNSLLVAYYDNDMETIKVENRHETDGSTYGTTVVIPKDLHGYALPYNFYSVSRGMFDFNLGKNVIVLGSNSYGTRVFTYAGSVPTLLPELGWNMTGGRLFYLDGRWSSIDYYTYQVNNYSQFFNFTDQITFAYTWYDSTSPTHESMLSPVRGIGSFANRAYIGVYWPAPQPSSDPDTPDSIRLYVRRGAGAYQLVNKFKELGPTGCILDLEGVTQPGPEQPPTVNGFASANKTPGGLRSVGLRADNTPKVNIQGDGTGRFDGLIPPGSMIMWAGSFFAIPAGWLLCDGLVYTNTTYPDLYAALGGTNNPWGLSGTTGFRVPDMRSRFPVGSESTSVYPVGSTGGLKDLYLTVNQLPAHSHTMTHGHSTDSAGDHAHGGSFSSAMGGGGKIARGTASESASGGTPTLSNGAHTHTVYNYNGSTGDAGYGLPINITPPYAAVNFIIKT